MAHADIDIGGFFLKFDKTSREYTAYETIQGVLCVNLRSDIKAKNLLIKIIGKLGVLWQDYEENSTTKNQTFTASNVFLDESISLIPPSNRKDGQTKIHKGYHEFPFSFCLVDFFKTSTESRHYDFPFSSENELGNVSYLVTGVLQRVAHDFDYQTVQFISILSALHKDAKEMKTFFEPYRIVQSKENSLLPSALRSDSNKSYLIVVCNKTAFKPGESINCLIRLENENILRKFAKIYVKLIQIVKFQSTQPYMSVKTIENEMFSFKQIDFDNNKSYDMDELIQIPHGIRPATTLHHQLIDYKYELRVELYSTIKFLPASTSTSATSQQIECAIPIIIYNELV